MGWLPMKLFNSRCLKNIRQRLRNDCSESEHRLWFRLKSRQLNGYKFRRQQGIGPYVVDFYCPTLHLVIEIDGDSHFDEISQIHDQRRDQYLENINIRVLRFTNLEIKENIEGVLQKIVQISNDGNPL